MSHAAPELDELHEVVATRLTEVGQRYTTGRRQLVERLADADRPLPMADLLRGLPDMPQSSAYRHLTVLASTGVVHRIASGADDTGSFELTDELSGHHHHHVVCEQCGAIADISSSPRLEKALKDAAALAAEESGFTIDAHRIELVGRCAKCTKQARTR